MYFITCFMNFYCNSHSPSKFRNRISPTEYYKRPDRDFLDHSLLDGHVRWLPGLPLQTLMNVGRAGEPPGPDAARPLMSFSPSCRPPCPPALTRSAKKKETSRNFQLDVASDHHWGKSSRV